MGNTMNFFIILSKRNLALLIAFVIITLLVTISVRTSAINRIDGSTNALRVAYIKSLGLEVDETAVSVKEIVIPVDFSDVYSRYNELQKKSGFDLTRFKGEKATVYCYQLSHNDEVNVHLIVADGGVIGGDIAETAYSGEMKPLG